MTDPTSPAAATPEPTDTATRRRVLATGAAAVAAGVAGVVAARPAAAANGGALVLGAANAATAQTSLKAGTSSPGLYVANSGTGRGIQVVAVAGIGIATQSSSASHAGLSAVNGAAAPGAGSALAAVGNRNYGVVATTLEATRSAILAQHLGTAPADYAAAVLADGRRADGVQALADAPDRYAVWGIHESGGDAVVGSSNGGAAVYGAGALGGFGVYAEAVDRGSTALYASGSVEVDGDLVVRGTIYCRNPLNPNPPAPAITSAAARRVSARAARRAERIRAARAQG
jgi:hypothetical protein